MLMLQVTNAAVRRFGNKVTSVSVVVGHLKRLDDCTIPGTQ